jgi:hypothetical protein
MIKASGGQLYYLVHPYSQSHGTFCSLLKLFCELEHFINTPYFTEYRAHFFYIENDAEIFPAHYTWKVAVKGFMMAFMMNKLAMINSCEITLEK